MYFGAKPRRSPSDPNRVHSGVPGRVSRLALREFQCSNSETKHGLSSSDFNVCLLCGPFPDLTPPLRQPIKFRQRGQKQPHLHLPILDPRLLLPHLRSCSLLGPYPHAHAGMILVVEQSSFGQARSNRGEKGLIKVCRIGATGVG